MHELHGAALVHDRHFDRQVQLGQLPLTNRGGVGAAAHHREGRYRRR